MKTNIVGWFEIPVKEMDRARKFYESVFDVMLEKVEESEQMSYWTFPHQPGLEGAGGALIKAEGLQPQAAGGITIYLMSEDCAVEESRVVPNGGEVIKTKFAIGEYGFISLVKDTEGNHIGLHSMK